jgi:sigma-B regulation protein RsbU (phosphoserine phosphatase)
LNLLLEPKVLAGDLANILVVDDTPANLQVLAGMLKERGYKVRPVPSGKLALLAARRDPPDLILLDINMPEMNGYEVCEHLKADERLADIPVIFISALTEPLDKVKAFSTGGVDYLTKPFQIEELNARVETHLNLRRLQIALEETNARLAKANGRMSGDLKAAGKIQETFLPREASRVPGTDFAWIRRPCDQLGGDALNVVPLGDGKVGVYILDVSGYGVVSTLLSVTLSHLLSPPSEPSSILIRNGDAADRLDITPPAEVAARLTRLFPFDSAPDKFATMLYGILNTATGEFRYVSAGHPGLVHLPSGANPVVLEGQGFPLGLDDNAYEERSVLLSPGDRLYLYSDGVSEATDAAGKPFGHPAILDVIAQGRSEPLRESLAILFADIARWHRFERFQDDISILAVEVTAASGEGGSHGSFPALASSVAPNTLNPEATLTLTTSKPGDVKADLFDAKDSPVRTILGSSYRAAGSHRMKIDDRGESGQKLAPGVYLVSGTTADGPFRNTVTILK